MALLFIFSTLSTMAFEAKAIGGSGTESSPYTLSNSADMDAFKQRIESGNYNDKYWKVTQDITWAIGHGIGTKDRPFKGTFDGGGYTVNIGSISARDLDYIGFFARAQDFTVKDFTLRYGYIDARDYVGGLAGEAVGNVTIHNVHIVGTSTTDSYGKYWGGMFGKIWAVGKVNISACSVNISSVNLRGSSSGHFETGGLIGFIEGSSNTVNISDCAVKVGFTISSEKAEYSTRKAIAGIIGVMHSPVNLVRCYTATPIPGTAGTYHRGIVVGYKNAYLSMRVIRNKYDGDRIGTNQSGGYSYWNQATNAAWSGNNRVYTDFERKADDTSDYPESQKGNELWGYSTSDMPKISKTGYAVRVDKGSNVGTVSGARYVYRDREYYLNSDEELTINSTSSNTYHQRIEYSFDADYNHSRGSFYNYSARQVGDTWKLTARVRGSVNAKIVNIPYTKWLNSNFDQWNSKITLSWTADNVDNLAGKWYIYKRVKDSGSVYTRTESNDVKNGSNQQYKHELNLASGDLEKDLEFVVSFVESGTTVGSTPVASNSATSYLSTKTNVSITLTAVGGLTDVKLSFNVPTQLDGNSNNTYTILRKKVGDKNFAPLQSNRNFSADDKTAEVYVYIDNEPSSSCDRYLYKLEIAAFGRVFSSETKDAVGITGSSSITKIKATKGEYAGYVRIAWSTSKLNNEASDRFRVFRKVATNPDDKGIEIATIDTKDQSYIYTDNNILPGVYYNYDVVIYQTCGSVETELMRMSDIGFSQSLGSVSGRITFGSGQAVKDVGVSVLRNDLQGNETQYRSLESKGEGMNLTWRADSDYFKDIFENDFSYQFWLNPSAANVGNNLKILDISDVATVIISQVDDQFFLRFLYYNANNVEKEMTNEAIEIDVNRFSHIALTRRDQVIKLYVVNDRNLTDIKMDSLMVTDARKNFIKAPKNPCVAMGYDFKGNIDEVRLWSKALTSEEILKDHNRMLTGSELGLKAYWTFDEGLSGHFFDISKVGTVFNGNHGTTTLESSDIIPTNEQLALKAITDRDGNFQIRGIPFSGEGCSYDVVPTLGVHQFNPTRQLRYISNSSLVHNNTDFKDISSFVLSGKVTYEGGTYPVEGCTFEIDDQIVVAPNGQAVKSDDFGNYAISVPIGEHKVRIVKSGHTFANDGLVLDGETKGNRNYNKPETSNFFDITKVKLIGRMVGGVVENDKALGFGESVNNIGAKTITLTAAKSQYKLIAKDTTVKVLHNRGEWKKSGGLPNDTSTVQYKANSIEINVSPITGEFVAWVYPEVFTVGKVEDSNYGEPFYAGGETLDLTMAAVPSTDMLKESVRTWTDSVYVSGKGVVGHYKQVEKSDTIFYNEKWTQYYQATPTMSGVQVDNNMEVAYFGETKYIIKNSLTGVSDTLNLLGEDESSVSYMFDMPLFVQGKQYQFNFNAYEEYKNYSTNQTIRYAVKGATVNLSNTIAFVAPEPIELDSLGNASYKFMAGAPDLTTATGEFGATVQVGSVSYYWDKGSVPIKAWHLGDKTTGTDFMTAGPNQITAILRDPPGSLSSSYIESGSTITTRNSLSAGFGLNAEIDLTTSLGPSVTTFIGLGAGTIITTETTIDVSVGLKTETKLTSGTETETSTTFTERFETSDDPLYVGNRGDVFIGNSTNIQYGLTNGISIQKDYVDATLEASSPALKEATIGSTNYSIAKSVALAYGQNFDTRFAFTQVEIEDIMIPKWEENLARLIKPVGTVVNNASISTPIYVSNLPHDDENFGKLNTDKDAFGASAVPVTKVGDGPSYTIHFPLVYNKADFKVDSVMWFNNQINGWIEVLAQNEKEKVEMKKEGNYSFGSGASISCSKTGTSSKTITTTFNGMISPSIGLVTGGEVMGVGMEFSSSVEFVAEIESSDGTTKESSISSGFTLKEEGDDDEITVDYGMTASGTIAFKTRGGRTSCPYEEVQYSKYFEPGQHILSEGTMQIEVPKIDIAGNDQMLAVPSNKTAIFNLAMKNESETGEDVWFELIVDEETNPYGAILKIDGGVIGNGKSFMVKAGQVLNKVLTVGKGTADVYENIGLILRSECQSDPTDFLPVIADTVRIKRIEFVPACSDVAIKSPVNNWIVNTKTGDELEVVLEGYDINFVNFGYVQLEYRSVSDTDWNSLMKFYGNPNIMEKAQGYKTLIPEGTQRVKYKWNQNTIPDGAYEVRAKAVCVNVDSEYKIIQEISEFTTDAVSGRKDTSIPQPLGSPSPANGIYSAGDEIAITFNENIRTGILTSSNFSIKGILNGDMIAEPVGGLAFSGTEYAYTELPIYNGGSFSIETWFKRDNNTAGTLFSYGLGENSISLVFDAEGHALVTIGDETKVSTQTISNTTRTWKYVGLSYNGESKTVSVYVWQDSDPTIKLFEKQLFGKTASLQGRLYSGSKIDGSDGFKGALAMMHFYNIYRTDTDMSASKNETKSGTEPNLVGLWKMDEGQGLIAADKARSRNMVVQGSWYLYPAGKSIAFNGTAQYATLPGDKCVFRPYDDFSVEFWFKAADQQVATLFAMGTAMDISFDESHNLMLNTVKESQKLTSTNLLDDKWHHLALTVKRNGSTNALLDGTVVSTFATTKLFDSSVGGGFCYLGVRYTEDAVAGVPVYDNHFKGNIDELRIWNNALTTSAVLLNKNNKLSGAENGLLAYYPFEKWIRNMDGSYNVLEWTKDITSETLQLAGSSIVSTIAVGLQDVRPVTEVAHSFTSSNNKVVLNITEELYKIEGVTLEISSNGIFDMYGNETKPITWVAYVNRNELNWETSELNFIMQEAEDLSFTAIVSNSGAERADFFIEDLPYWLSVNSSQGSLKPLSSKEVEFTVSSSINIGTYETSLVLMGTNNVRKVLALRLKVTGQRPDWTVNPNDFEKSMNVIGKILLDSKPKEDSDDILAAFIDDKCVGVASPMYVSANNAYFTFIDVYGHTEDYNKSITFKLWEASTGHVYPELNCSVNDISFKSNELLGTIVSPVTFNAVDMIEQYIPLKKGWTWISTNLVSDDPAILSQMKRSLLDAGVLIKGRNAYVQQPEWVGILTQISEKSMYVVNTTEDCALKLKGKRANPELTPIDIETGWNWIGYIPSFNSNVKSALAGLNASEGEQVKGQKGYAIYSEGIGWIGSLTSMQPGKGYMYYSTSENSKKLVYPSVASQILKSSNVAVTNSQTKWIADNSKFSGSMTVTAIVVNSQAKLRSDKIEIAAFCGGECRGSVMLKYEESLDEYLGFLMVYGNDNEEISFHLFDHESGEIIVVNNAHLTYATDAMHGSPDKPYKLSTDLKNNLNNYSLSQISAYPNPVEQDLYVNYSFEVLDLIEIVDMSGRSIMKEPKFNKTSVNVSAFESGMYILKVTQGEEVRMIKFNKK